MNRSMNRKDTFLNLFPSYGVRPDQVDSEVMRTMKYDDFNSIEQRKTIDLDRSHFAKWDEMKKFTEELLKT